MCKAILHCIPTPKKILNELKNIENILKIKGNIFMTLEARGRALTQDSRSPNLEKIYLKLATIKD